MVAEVLLTPAVAFWKGEIDLYERSADKWLRRGRKILKRYKDVRTPREEAVTRFNVLWSNVQTRLPALYARDPKPEVERRFKDRDPIGRVVSDVLERCLDYTVQHCNPFGRIIRQAVLDYEIAGRGTVWVRYVPHLEGKRAENMDGGSGQGVPDSEDIEHTPKQEVDAQGPEVSNEADDEVDEETLTYEETLVDYVYWEDFGHTWARTWDEVRAVWRRVYLTREELTERFGAKAKDVPLDWSPKTLNDSKVRLDNKKATVYEIWDKHDHKVIWVTKNFARTLDERDDPLGLEGFFPCPCPIYANLGPDELIPTPNFVYYQDQANEVDELSSRITAIGKALKVAGVRDTSAEGLDRLLSEGVENQLVPVDGWMALKEKGGLAGVMELLPVKDIADTLGSLREQRQTMIDDIFQITGMSDIIRGLSEPNETATAQQIKGQFAVLRLSDAQTEVQRFCRDTIRIMAEIIADYDIETIKQISGVQLLTNAEKMVLQQQIAMQQQMQQQPPPGQPPAPSPQGAMPGQPPPQGMPGQAGQMHPMQAPQGASQPGQAPISPDKLKLLKEPTWEEVEAMLANKVLRDFRIDVETDSTIRMDEDADREARTEFITAAAGFMQQAAMAPPAMIPAVGEMFLFGVRGFKTARNLERVFEDCLEELKNQPPKPTPEQEKAQFEMQKAQIDAQTQMQIEDKRGQVQIQIAQGQQAAQAQDTQFANQVEAQRKEREVQITTQHEAMLEQLKQQHDAERVKYETEAKKQIADADNATKLQIAAMQQEHERNLTAMKQDHERQLTSMTQQHEASMTDRKGQQELALVHHKGEKDKELVKEKGAHDEKLTHIKGKQEEHMAHVKPTAEAKAKGEAEVPEHATKAIEKLADAIKAARKPRKVNRDKDGRITEIE